ncbi:hypothetical protein FHR72_001143 [Mycolicibacterium iranicum]|uniref:Uncharacterized protein n=1 Tax=Mycolicibacterium iranicum TaxID=912594 RepID=A0A839Q0E3_MYCIR|nr:hypothetical protein [Mycolicibacterium iranicum]MBB2989680.1 hypothetical protein [Mycolicibacterium iranicum]
MAVAGAPLVPANDDKRNMVPPSSLVLKPGKPAEFIKLGQPYLKRPEGPTPVLEYGRELHGLGHTCNTAETGISCRNDQTGYGFTFSSKGYSFQYTPVSPASEQTPPVARQQPAGDETAVLGAPGDEYSVGYGTRRPDRISTNSLCGNTVESISWDNWGAPVATGTGTWCQNSGSRSRGEPPRPVKLTASDLATCGGVRAYRTLQFDDGTRESICAG